MGGVVRPIRFRAWDGDEMLEWTDMLKHKGVMWSVLGGTTVTRFQHQYDTVGETLPMYEVMQFTGLQDSQGVDIYESDLLEWDEQEWGGKQIDIVEWDYELLNMRKNDWKEYCKVIGNIYANPELMK